MNTNPNMTLKQFSTLLDAWKKRFFESDFPNTYLWRGTAYQLLCAIHRDPLGHVLLEMGPFLSSQMIGAHLREFVKGGHRDLKAFWDGENCYWEIHRSV
jgi:hypothetical protein